jgi:hypothetical protein
LGIGDWELETGAGDWDLGKISSYFTSRLLKLQFPIPSFRKRLSATRQKAGGSYAKAILLVQ